MPPIYKWWTWQEVDIMYEKEMKCPEICKNLVIYTKEACILVYNIMIFFKTYSSSAFDVPPFQLKSKCSFSVSIGSKWSTFIADIACWSCWSWCSTKIGWGGWQNFSITKEDIHLEGSHLSTQGLSSVNSIVGVSWDANSRIGNT